MNHDPLCDAGPREDGWAPPCEKLTKVPAHEYDYPACSFCWNIEDNCYCQCDLIARVREDERMRDDDYAYVATQSYAAALRDAVEAVKVLPSAWTDSAYRDKAIAAIEALGGER